MSRGMRKKMHVSVFHRCLMDKAAQHPALYLESAAFRLYRGVPLPVTHQGPEGWARSTA